MPPRAQYQLHRYAVRPGSLAPEDRQVKAKLATRSRAALVSIPKGVLTDLRATAAKWDKQANDLERAPGALLITSAAARQATIKTLRRVASALRELLNEI